MVERLCDLLNDRHADFNLQVLHLGHNDLSKRSAASLAYVLYSNTTIRELDLSYNHLGHEGAQELSKSLSGTNATLETLLLDGNKLGPKGTKAIAQLLRNNSSIHEIGLGSNDIGVRGIKALVGGGSGGGSSRTIGGRSPLSSLRTLRLSGNGLGGKGISQLALSLKESSHGLSFLDLSSNQAREAGAQAICDWLLFDKTLQVLWLTSNSFGASGGQAFDGVLKFNYSLRELRLGGNELGDAGVKALAGGLGDNTSLQRLALDYNHVGDAGAEAIAEVLKKNSTLEFLALNGNNIQHGCAELAYALPYVTGLRALNLASNDMRDDAAFAFADMLVKSNSTFEMLDWRDNKLTPVGMAALESAFRYRTNLRKWLNRLLTDDLRHNKLKCLNWSSKEAIGDHEVTAVATVLGEGGSPGLNSVYLGGDMITSTAVQSLCQHVLANPSVPCPRLVRLYIRGSSIGNEGSTMLGDALRNNSTLRSLSLTSSLITMAGAADLGKGLSANNTLERLTLGHNALRSEGLSRLVESLVDHPSLLSVNVMSNGIQGENQSGMWDGLAATRLKELDLQDNELTDSALREFAQSLFDQCPFKYINLCGNPSTSRGVQFLRRILPQDTELLA